MAEALDWSFCVCFQTLFLLLGSSLHLSANPAVETSKDGVGSGDASVGLHFTCHGTENISKLPASLIYSYSSTVALFRRWRPEI